MACKARQQRALDEHCGRVATTAERRVMSEQFKTTGMNSRSFTFVAAMLWALSATCVVLVLRNLHTRAASLYDELDVALPGVLELGLDAGRFLHTPLGLGVAGGAIVFSSIPLLLGKSGKLLSTTYLVLGGAVLAFGIMTFFANQDTLSTLEQLTNSRSSPR